ncbi:MAG: type II toxin-antitoxin system VapC family toxin, partial [Prochlorothrix sp.]
MVNLRFLLDTNIISEPFKLQPSPTVVDKLQQHSDNSAISAVTWHELLYGFHRLPESRRKKQLEIYLFEIIEPNLPIIPYDNKAAEWFAIERARLIALGHPPAYADGQIAAIAQVNNLILVTRNLSDYCNFLGLTLTNWFESPPTPPAHK